MIARGILDLLHTVCEAEIVSLIVRSTNGTLNKYTANFAGFLPEIVDDFSAISVSDFNNLFPDFQVETKYDQDFYPAGNKEKKIASYITIPLTIGGEQFASVHIANSINDYFTPGILENIRVFLASATPIIATSLSMLELAELQKNTRAAFAQYVPADIMDEIINKSSKAVSQSENRKVAVLFNDIRDFTSISEHSSAHDIVEFLNSYFAQMGNEIISERGHIDKFIGDSIMAVFGAFQNLENASANAIRAAVKMLAVLEKIDASGIAVSKDSLKIGVGINYGECILGNIGFQNKKDYTVIGDTVNLASRIEGLAKIYHHPLIVSEYVYNETKNSFLFRKVDIVRVKGKENPVGIYAIYTGFEGAAGNVLRSGEVAGVPVVSSLLINRETLVNYNKGLHLFNMREWKPAREYFLKSLETNKDDYLSQLYLERIHTFECTPPPDDWDGVITLVEK
jgi:class 3 adenylate cyclase